MNVEPAGNSQAGPSTKRTRTAKVTVLEEAETPPPMSVKRKTNARSAMVQATIEDDAGSDHIPEVEAEAVSTAAPPKSRSRKAKDSASSRLPRATRTLRTPLTESTTTKDEEEEVEMDLVASTHEKPPRGSRAKAVRSTTGSSSSNSKNSSAATSSIARRAKGGDENTAPVVLESAARVTRTRRRK